jgi:signal transduction histidine kinase
MTPAPVRRTVPGVTSPSRLAPPAPGAPAPPPWPALRVPGVVRLVAPVVVIALVQVGVTIVAARHQPETRDMDALGVALLAAGPAALLMRRTRPVETLLVAWASTMAYLLLDYGMGPAFLALIVALVAAVVRGHRRVAWAVIGVGYVLSAWVEPWLNDRDDWPDWTAAVALATWLLILGLGSELARTWLERTAERARAQAEEARRLAGEERLRIARELHDVLAHNISLINVRAGVALHLVDDRPERIDADQVRPALAAIKDASRDALGELRSVLDILRQGDAEAAPLAPTAGLVDLDALAERARGTGLDVRIEREDAAVVGLPAGVDLAAFRVAQEALTNVVRHAQATRVTLRVRRTDDELEVQVDDDGVGPAAAAAAAAHHGDGRDRNGDGSPGGGGRGIAGMRERAHALGGTLEAGPRPGRGFRVRARFPVRSDG